MDIQDENERKKSKKEAEKILADISAQIANETNKSLQRGSEELDAGLQFFLDKVGRIEKVGYEQSKGNMFEYIENLKIMRNIANQGEKMPDIQPITDLPKESGGYGGHMDPADFRIMRKGERVQLTQAKVHNNPQSTVKDMLNPKYKGMKFLVPTDQVEATKDALKKAYENNKMTYTQYRLCLKRLETKGLRDHKTGVSSGGTTTDEICALKGKNGRISVKKAEAFAKELQQEQYYRELQGQVVSGAIGGGLAAGIIATTANLFAVYKDEKELKQALKDIGLLTAKGAVAGAVKSAIATIIRRKGATAIPILKNSNVATAIASAMIECGIAVHAYAKGEISKEELVEAVGMTIVRTTATYYFTEAIASSGISASLGVTSAIGMFAPMAAFMAMQYTAMTFLAIGNNSMLRAEEHRRVAALYREAIQSIVEYRQNVDKALENHTKHRQLMMIEFLNIVDDNVLDEQNYSKAIIASVCFAKQLNFDLKHANFEEFKKAMNSNQPIDWG